MVQLLEPIFWVEEEALPVLLEMPRIWRRPKMPAFRPSPPLARKLLTQVRRSRQRLDSAAFGLAYGKLLAECQPWIRWALSCWEYLLSTEGCRFLLRSAQEKRYCRGDYRVFTEADFSRWVHRAFKECLLMHLAGPPTADFQWSLRRNLWPTIVGSYRALEQPPDERQRHLTAYSYLRCVPYQFLNSYHHERVAATLNGLPSDQRRVVELYYLCFFKEEAAWGALQISGEVFQRLREDALKTLAQRDSLTCALLLQIERY